MKSISAIIGLFEKGDRVQTPNGKATIVEDEDLGFAPNREDVAYSKVEVQLDEPCHRHPDGRYKCDTVDCIEI